MDLTIEKRVNRENILTRDWLKIYVDEATFGPETKHVERVVIEHPGAACILAITPDDEVVLVAQYRYATGETLYEIPAGKNDTWKTDFSITAARELAEETPYTAGKLEFIYQFYIAPGYSDELISLYKATDLKKNSTLTLDEDESLQVRLYNKAEIKEMLNDGRICDGKTIIALQHWLNEND